MLLTDSNKDVSKGQLIVIILFVSPYLIIKLTLYRVLRMGWSALVFYFERYEFESWLGGEYRYKFLVVSLTESR